MNKIWTVNPCRSLFGQTMRFISKKNCLVLIMLLIVGQYSVDAKDMLFSKTDIYKMSSLLERICKKYDKICRPCQTTGNTADLSISKNIQLFHQVQPQATVKFSMNGILTRNKRSLTKKTNNVSSGQDDANELSMKMSSQKITQFCELTSEQHSTNIAYVCKVFYAELYKELIGDTVQNRIASSSQAFLHRTKMHGGQVTLLRNNVTVIINASQQWHIPINTTTLSLRNLKIVKIYGKAFYSLQDNLRHLSLDNNAISYIAKKAFTGIDGLLDLDLSHNHIQSLPACVFSGLIRLRKLNLMHNEIEYIGWKTFSGLQSLVYLDLSSNGLEDIHTFALRGLRSTQSVIIDLSRNKLTLPKKEWLLLGKSANNLCNKDSKESSLKQKHFQASEVISKNKFVRNETHRLSTKRIIWAEENSWSCSCTGPSNILDFTKIMILSQSFVTANDFLLEPVEDNFNQAEHTFQYDSIFQINWEVALSCTESGNLSGLTINTSPKSLKLVSEYCCVEMLESSDKGSCEFINEWLKNNTEFAPEEIPPASGLTNNQVTVVGIIIVVLSPVLLTLCPDCHQEVSSSGKKRKKNENDKKLDDKRARNNRDNIVVTKLLSDTSDKADSG